MLRTADAAGAGAVVFAGDAVDPYNGKCVRASAGSLFHVDVVRAEAPLALVAALRAAGLKVLAADGYGEDDLDELADAGALAQPTAWLFGSEAHGLPDEVAAACRRPGPGTAPRARGEPQPRCGRGGVPVLFSQRTSSKDLIACAPARALASPPVPAGGRWAPDSFLSHTLTCGRRRSRDRRTAGTPRVRRLSRFRPRWETR